MSEQVLTWLRQDHDYVRSLRQALAYQVATVAREHEPDYDLMRELISYLLDAPERYHHAVERYLIQRLTKGHRSGDELVARLRRRYRIMTRLGRRLQGQLEAIRIEVPVKRHRFVTFAHSYLRLHEAQLAEEENRLFPVLASSLEPPDWVAATTAFQWYSNADYLSLESIACQDLRERVAGLLSQSPAVTKAGSCPLCAIE